MRNVPKSSISNLANFEYGFKAVDIINERTACCHGLDCFSPNIRAPKKANQSQNHTKLTKHLCTCPGGIKFSPKLPLTFDL